MNSPQENQVIEELEHLWTVQQTAKFLGMQPQTIRGWVRQGKLKQIKLSNRVRIPRSEVERLVAEARNKMKGIN